MGIQDIEHSPSFPQFRAKLREIYSEIISLPSLVPSPETNAAFTKLIEFISFPFDNSDSLHASVLNTSDNLIATDLHRLCAEAEGNLESYWSRQLIKPPSNPTTSWFSLPKRYTRLPAPISLEPFPYLQNYRSLVGLEVGLLRAVEAELNEVVFIGSGPLPLSSLILGRDHIGVESRRGWNVTSVDVDAPALQQGAQLVAAALGSSLSHPDDKRFNASHSSGTFTFLAESALSPNLTQSLAKANVVFLAALVGLDRASKIEIALHIISNMSAGAHLLMRSAEGLRMFAYPAAPQEEIVKKAREQGTPVQLIMIAHPRNEIINSVVILKRVE
ncbi:hypothetical protein P7C70_g2574, partial [Phenoliferia sp. Uapishka_3]